MINPVQKVNSFIHNNIKREKSQYEYIDSIHAQRELSNSLHLYNDRGKQWKFHSKASWGSC